MMAFASLEDVIPQILKNIDFHQYLLDNGYKLLPNKNVKGFKCYAKQSSLILEDDIVFVGHSKGVDIYIIVLFSAILATLLILLKTDLSEKMIIQFLLL
jgi:hypothetical protein